MKRIQGKNIWDIDDAHWLCITTNGMFRRNASAAMGAGIAKEACQRVPGIDHKLGKKLRQNGHVFQYIDHEFPLRRGRSLFSFPTKIDWRVPTSPLWLIAKSCEQLRDAWESAGRQHTVLLPAPGCGNGNLEYAEVLPVLDRYFGDTDKIWIVSL